ncbi:MAG: ankyrin repeat domain-containing protein [Clostridiaceae bacterium]|jgi:ankyrin repeat protein|nr:ankyrin repeat domain-containing protein [Clostridiaceae bacterium]
MKKRIALIALLLAIQCGITMVNADTQTTQQMQYISTIQAQGLKYDSFGFMQAIINNNALLTEDFIKAGMSPKTTWGKVPAIYTAINCGSDKALKVLLSNGVNPNTLISGESPLKIAIGKKQPQIVDILIAYGADVNASTNNESPLNYALKKKQIKIATSLLNAGAQVNDETLVRAVKTKDNAIKDAVLRQYKK